MGILALFYSFATAQSNHLAPLTTESINVALVCEFAAKVVICIGHFFSPARQPRQLRSFHSNLLFVPSVKTNVGTRALSAAAPTLWNSLPVSVKF